MFKDVFGNPIVVLILRTMLMYGVTFLMMRIMGKREIGKLSIFDLVISIMIAEIAVVVIEDVSKPLHEGLIPIVVLVLVQVLLAFWGLNNRKVRQIFDGKPSVIISNGKLNRKEMSKLRYNLDDLMQQLRGKDVDSLADVEFAVLETSGQLTVIQKDDSSSSPSSSQDKESSKETGTSAGTRRKTGYKEEPVPIPYEKIKYQGLPVPLIMDGKVQDENLSMVDKNRFWLKNEIRKHGVRDFKDIFLCSLDHKGRIYIDTKDK
ncbi:hypothetical protein E6C60_1290 [Paenibacillus algicola]|uniref:YetF C-terminal domain-containing protein n=1 Tax=Paenibacillus algicola TaxID=2565926 RepID=A0A4P8XHL3_9BACL|nr:DUF421 domain-containing protein [Paenibacillus algicola]QCT02006.1 hypothetical protein E6C60_1290 [Paenibacillus algicola]